MPKNPELLKNFAISLLLQIQRIGIKQKIIDADSGNSRFITAHKYIFAKDYYFLE